MRRWLYFLFGTKTLLVLTAVNMIIMAVGLYGRHHPTRLEEYRAQEVILGPTQNPDCTHATTVGAMVEALTNPGGYGSDTWFHDHLRWMYLCGAVQDEKKRRGIAPYCDKKDRCA